MKVFRPKYLYQKGALVENCELRVDETGRITAINVVSSPDRSDIRADVYPNHALIPGFVNVHSHAFQRALRGLTQVRSPKGKDTFWTWRQSMYRLMNGLSPEDVYQVSKLCFQEMLSQGITTVGEFHYVHHQKGGAYYEDRNELSHRIIQAAKDVGIRLCLLESLYLHGNFGQGPKTEQKRFCDRSIDDFIRRFEDISVHCDATLTFGFAPHSLRAVSFDELKQLHSFVKGRGFPVHMHLHEQIKEIVECKKFYRGKTPIEMVAKTGMMSENFTAIHATHLTKNDVSILKKNNVHVAACPSTEADLGDGILAADELEKQKIDICFGSDSQVQINFFNECRLIENHLRLRSMGRNQVSKNPAKTIFPMSNENGARSLGLKTGELRPGFWADFSMVSLNHISLALSQPKTLLTQMLFSGTGDLIDEVYVGGKRMYERQR